MATIMVRDLVGVLDKLFPPFLAEKWDNVGLQLGSLQQKVEKVAVALDIDIETVLMARDAKVDLIISHHPLFFKSINRVDYGKSQGAMIRELIQAQISVYSAHTNLDSAPRGLNQYLAEKLELEDITPFSGGREEPLYKIVVFVPATHTEELRRAISSRGAGHIGNYSDCTFRVAGIGTFKPLEGTHPFIGEPGKVEEVNEFRLETVVPEGRLSAVLEAMHRAHPYEEVAYDVYRLSNPGIVNTPARRGRLLTPRTLDELVQEVKQRLDLEYALVVGDGEAKVEKIGVVSGSGASFIPQARAQGLDVLITGDLKYHEAREAQILGLNIIDAGHFGTEKIVVDLIADIIRKEAVARKWAIEVVKSTGSSPFRCI